MLGGVPLSHSRDEYWHSDEFDDDSLGICLFSSSRAAIDTANRARKLSDAQIAGPD
jgi:hypothetical protein